MDTGANYSGWLCRWRHSPNDQPNLTILLARYRHLDGVVFYTTSTDGALVDEFVVLQSLLIRDWELVCFYFEPDDSEDQLLTPNNMWTHTV